MVKLLKIIAIMAWFVEGIKVYFFHGDWVSFWTMTVFLFIILTEVNKSDDN